MLESFLTTIPRPSAAPTKLDGGYLGARIGAKVSIPWLDRRRLEGIVLPMKHPVVDLLMKYGAGPGDPPIRDKTLEIAAKTYYHGRPVFHGPLMAPKYDFIAGTVEIVACDPSLRIERARLGVADPAVTDGVTIDGPGMFSLLAAAQNQPDQDALDWPALGVIPGLDLTTDAAALQKFQRLDEIWASMKELADNYIGPDFELEPFETDPAELASGTDEDAVGGPIGSGAGTVTNFTIDVARTGAIGGLRLGIWATHSNPRKVDIDLIHPDGTTVRIYTGANDKPAAGSNFLGTGDTLAEMARFQTGHSIYAAAEAYPHVGEFASKLSRLWGKPAAGTWTLRFTAHDANFGTLDDWRLDFLLPAPAYCRLNVSDKPDTDAPPEPACTFYAGHGPGNARVFTVTPRGDLETNQFIATSKAGGTRYPVNDLARADYGTYQDADSPGDQATSEQLLEWGRLQVGAYSRPLPELELAPKDDSGSNETLRYGEDFGGGSVVRVLGKDGYAYWDRLAQIRDVTLTNQGSSVRTELSVVPLGVPAADIGES